MAPLAAVGRWQAETLLVAGRIDLRRSCKKSANAEDILAFLARQAIRIDGPAILEWTGRLPQNTGPRGEGYGGGSL